MAEVGYRVFMARPAPASVRATDIISFLTAHPSRAFTISELVRHLGMNIASAHATLAVLCDCGFLIRDPVHRTYVLGPAFAVTGFAALEQHPAIEAAIEQAEVLAAELNAEVGVTAIAGRDVIFLARRGPDIGTAEIGYPGDRSPPLAPVGAVFMAWADEDAEQHLAEVFQETDEMLLSFGNLSAPDEIVFKTVAAPIFDPMGRVLLSLTITGPEHPVRVDDVLDLGRRLVQSATIATRQARGRVPGRDASARAAAR